MRRYTSLSLPREQPGGNEIHDILLEPVTHGKKVPSLYILVWRNIDYIYHMAWPKMFSNGWLALVWTETDPADSTGAAEIVRLTT